MTCSGYTAGMLIDLYSLYHEEISVALAVVCVLIWIWRKLKASKSIEGEVADVESVDGLPAGADTADQSFWSGLVRTRSALASGLGQFFNSEATGGARFEALLLLVLADAH